MQGAVRGHAAAAGRSSWSKPTFRRNPTEVPPPVGNRSPQTVRVDLVAVELEGRLAEGTTFGYWTFNGKVPGPMLRVRVGDTLEVHVKNSADSSMIHSVDFHAATGPGGGAAASQVDPGHEKSFKFKALVPGLFVYHCATPMVAHHIANGMYGLILVEPEGGLPPVDREFYVMQGEIYTEASFGQHGSQEFSVEKLLNERPEYFVFNGSVGALSKLHPLEAKVGETVRIYFGVGGPNYTSSFHVIGEIFDRVYNLGDVLSPPGRGIQTVTVPAGGATIVEFKLDVPGNLHPGRPCVVARGARPARDLEGRRPEQSGNLRRKNRPERSPLKDGVARNPSMREPRNRVVQVSRFGNADGLQVVDAPLPTADRGEVRVRVLASSLQYTDVTIRRHLYPQTAARRPPFVMGYDVVGEIDQLGDGVSGFQVGDRVADMTVVGSNAAYRTLRADHLTRVPAGVDAAEAATLILSWTTAYQLLHRAARVQRGQRVLVHGAAGAVGQALLVLGRLAGLELWGTARGEHAALVRELGATPIDYQREDFTRVLPGGFDVVFDGIGEDGYRRSFAALKRGGLLCAYGYSAGVQAQRRMRTILMWIARLYLWRWLAWRQARPLLLDQRDAGAPSCLVPGGPGAALRPVGEWRHPAARRRADLLR